MHEIKNCDDVSRVAQSRKNYCQVKHDKHAIEQAKQSLLSYCPIGATIQSIPTGFTGETRRYLFFVICIPDSEQSDQRPYLHEITHQIHVYRGHKMYIAGGSLGIATQGYDDDIIGALAVALYDDRNALKVIRK